MLGQIGRFLSSLEEGVRLRLALFAVELREEKQRAIRTSLFAATVWVLVLAGLLLLDAALLGFLWETHGPMAAVWLGIGHLGVALALALIGWIVLRRQQPPFAQTIAELQKDREQFSSPSRHGE